MKNEKIVRPRPRFADARLSLIASFFFSSQSVLRVRLPPCAGNWMADDGGRTPPVPSLLWPRNVFSHRRHGNAQREYDALSRRASLSAAGVRRVPSPRHQSRTPSLRSVRIDRVLRNVDRVIAATTATYGNAPNNSIGWCVKKTSLPRSLLSKFLNLKFLFRIFI